MNLIDDVNSIISAVARDKHGNIPERSEAVLSKT